MKRKEHSDAKHCGGWDVSRSQQKSVGKDLAKTPTNPTVTTVLQHFLPVLHSIEGVFTGDIIHEDKAHGSSVVGCGDGPVSFLSSCILQQNGIFRL